MRIRPETHADAVAIAAVHQACFETDVEARIVDQLRADGDLRISLVAVDDGDVVGHVAFSPVTHGGLGLGPVAVVSAHRGRGVAARLIEAGLSHARESGTPFVVVLGDPAYYRRFGFGPASARGLVDDYAGGDAFQVLELRPGGIPEGARHIHYASPFATAAP